MREVKTLLLVRPPRSPRDMSDQENGVPPPHDAHELGVSAAHSSQSSMPHACPVYQKSNAMSANELCTSSPELGNPALPKDKEQEAYKILEKEWEDDPGNARNWSPKKKWTAVCIVRLGIHPLRSLPDLMTMKGLSLHLYFTTCELYDGTGHSASGH